MPKENTFINPMSIQELQILMHTMLEQSRKNGATTAAIKLTVEELRQLLALLTRPEAQELELGQSLEHALIQLLERVQGVESSQSHLLASLSALDDRLEHLEAGQATILGSLEPIAGAVQAIRQMELGQKQLMSQISEYLADPLPQAVSPVQ